MRSTADRRVRLRVAVKCGAAAQDGADDCQAALLDLLRAAHRGGAVNAARQIQRRSGDDADIAKLANEALAAFDCQIRPSLAELLAVLKQDGHRRWTDMFAQVSDRHMAALSTPAAGTVQAARRRLRTLTRP